MPRRPAPSDRPARPKPDRRAAEDKTNWLYGFHAVGAAWLNPERRCHRLLMTPAALEVFGPVLADARQQKLTRPQPEQVDRDQLDRMMPGAVHQGIALDAAALEDTPLEDVLRGTEALPYASIVVLDQVTDPHNVGAILRSAAAFGALAVVMTDRGAPPVTGVLAKTASGAVDVVPMVKVNNLAQALDTLKEAGFWTAGLAEEGKDVFGKADLSGKVAIVLGAEGEGLRRLTMERCDLLLRLPTVPPIGSLNVSNAAAVALYELARSRKV